MNMANTKDDFSGGCIGDIHTDKVVLYRMQANQRLSAFGMRICGECGNLVDVDFHQHGDRVLHNSDKHSSFVPVDAASFDNKEDN